MNRKSKLAILELLVGLFGWVWIVASIVALYFLAIAVFSDGAWSQFFWALGTSIVAKWLARGFEENKERVAYEEKLIDEEYSHEETGKKTVQEYSGTSEVQSQANDVMAIIQAYGKALETEAPAPGSVADENKLPYPKDTIKEAIIAGLKSTDNDQMKEQLKVGYIQLADWQPGVGATNQGLDISSIDINQDTESLAKAVLEQSSGSEKWTAMAQKEQEALKQELQDLGLW